MSTPEIMTAFSTGLAAINLDETGTPRRGAEAERMKTASATIYDLAVERSSGNDLWNWGMHDPEVVRDIERTIADFGRFGTDGFSEQLYFQALRGIPMSFDDYAGKTVLEIGCGPGEGLNFLSRAVPTARFVGVDLSPMAVRRANALLARGEQLRFVHGDAEELPFEDGAVDVVVNIESSHTYPDLGRFLGEVSRVLRPGGHLTHIDLFTRQRYAHFQRLAPGVEGLDWVREFDLSEQVRAAVRARMAPDSHFHRALARERMSALARRVQEHSRILMFGGAFAGYRPSRTIRVLHRLGVVPWLSGLPMESYRQHVARRR
ncbi:class I SAM-dependent methyltransferase [Saccharopolyspora sp. NFXS83]|uniref:class I SAM-dependent methyltransferase n=1 Tax=Saccharopolyspora sp. NFXS83 TaxID=2993560 RepID=UPI00224B2EB0|nr:class I SAM-dependent methyltransferase [Saccharopolyspora sp. NFXS83]MCX2729164.1 class I SAM-dependent methyltransferase [Saccharopolyspora sp. NFXS83]